MAKLMCCVVIGLIALVAVEALVQGDCPLASQVTSCSPKCLKDSECTSIGGRCCPNLCNFKSCVLPKSGSVGGYKGSTSGAGTYCGNVKCSAYEKCELDRTTKRSKCVRS